MITFKQYLLGENEDSHQAVLEQVASLLKRDCQPFLQASDKKLFFRGMDVDYNKAEPVVAKKAMYKVPVTKNREPKDSPDWLHKALNNKMVELTGHKVRSKCLFAAGDTHIANNYGKVFAVFPIGDFDYVWSKSVADPAQEFYMNVFHDENLEPNTPATKKLLREFLQYLKKNYPDQIKASNNNVAYWVNEFDRNGEKYIDFIEKFIEENDFWIYNKDLPMASSPKYKEHEVMFLCNSYYAVDAEIVRDVMKEIT